MNRKHIFYLILVNLHIPKKERQAGLKSTWEKRVLASWQTTTNQNNRKRIGNNDNIYCPHYLFIVLNAIVIRKRWQSLALCPCDLLYLYTGLSPTPVDLACSINWLLPVWDRGTLPLFARSLTSVHLIVLIYGRKFHHTTVESSYLLFLKTFSINLFANLLNWDHRPQQQTIVVLSANLYQRFPLSSKW